MEKQRSIFQKLPEKKKAPQHRGDTSHAAAPKSIFKNFLGGNLKKFACYFASSSFSQDLRYSKFFQADQARTIPAASAWCGGMTLKPSSQRGDSGITGPPHAKGRLRFALWDHPPLGKSPDPDPGSPAQARAFPPRGMGRFT
jgi:hypothetical protein